MRRCLPLVILLLASAVHADRDDGPQVFRADGDIRERMLDNLVKSGRLDAKLRASFPTRATATRELAKLSLAKTKTKKPIDAAACVLASGTGELTFLCRERGCAGSCQVIRNEVTIRVRNNVWAVTGTNVKRLGDTGECGCCMNMD